MIDKRKAARMARLVVRWRRSGESGAGFARRHDVHPWTFWYWCRKLSTERRLASATGSKPASFVPVQMTVEADAPVVEIVFTGGDRVKILAWDQSGFWVLYKRLERGTFAWPAEDADEPVTMRSGDLLLLLAGVDLAHTRRRRWYERVA